MFHEFDDVFNRNKHRLTLELRMVNDANILPTKYLREEVCSISASDPASERKYGHFLAQ
jgi:hypothetical protein